MKLFLHFSYRYENVSHSANQEGFNLDFLRLSANDTFFWHDLSLWKSFRQWKAREIQLRFSKIVC